MASDFKPCPFCGGTDIRCDSHGKASRDPTHLVINVWSMCCYNCGATFPNRYNRELLVENWNRRALLDGDQVPGMPEAICHACGLGYRCTNEDCPNETPDPAWPVNE